MEQEVISTRNKNIDSAINELCGKLRKSADSYQAVIFLAAIDYDFPLLSQKMKEKFPTAEVIGTSTAGEFSASGFTEGSLILTTMSDSSTKVKGVFIDKASKYPIAYKNDIESALKSVGINIGDPNSHRDAFAIEFTNAIYNAEETILSNFYAIIKNDKFPLAGATAGYTGNTPKSFVSYNGKTTQDGAVMLFVKTRCKFDIRQEDIFNPTGKQIYVTRSDTMKRELHTLNGRPAASDKKITTFARVTPNSTLEMMHIGDALKKADETCSGIRSVIPRPKFTLLMTCITRTMYFDRSGMKGSIIDKYKNTFPTFCGFSCYGEQIGRIHCNQTLVSLVIGD